MNSLDYYLILPKELNNVILSFLNTEDDIMSFSLTCKVFNSLVTQDILDLYTNHLLKLLKLYSDVSWNWYWISSNPNITRNPLGCKDLTSLGK